MPASTPEQVPAASAVAPETVSQAIDHTQINNYLKKYKERFPATFKASAQKVSKAAASSQDNLQEKPSFLMQEYLDAYKELDSLHAVPKNEAKRKELEQIMNNNAQAFHDIMKSSGNQNLDLILENTERATNKNTGALDTLLEWTKKLKKKQATIVSRPDGQGTTLKIGGGKLPELTATDMALSQLGGNDHFGKALLYLYAFLEKKLRVPDKAFNAAIQETIKRWNEENSNSEYSLALESKESGTGISAINKKTGKYVKIEEDAKINPKVLVEYLEKRIQEKNDLKDYTIELLGANQENNVKFGGPTPDNVTKFGTKGDSSPPGNVLELGKEGDSSPRGNVLEFEAKDPLTATGGLGNNIVKHNDDASLTPGTS